MIYSCRVCPLVCRCLLRSCYWVDQCRNASSTLMLKLLHKHNKIRFVRFNRFRLFTSFLVETEPLMHQNNMLQVCNNLYHMFLRFVISACYKWLHLSSYLQYFKLMIVYLVNRSMVAISVKLLMHILVTWIEICQYLFVPVDSLLFILLSFHPSQLYSHHKKF